MRPVSKKMDDTSALSGRTMKELAEGGVVWQSNRAAAKAPRAPAAKEKLGNHPPPQEAKFIEPMKARLVKLQVYVPLNTPVTYERTKPFARALAELLEKLFPDLALSNMRKDLRGKKVIVDWSRNDPHKTTVNVYSLRAKDHPTVSTPVTRDEIEAAQKKKKAGLLVFEADDARKRAEKRGDLFAPVLTLKQKLPRSSHLFLRHALIHTCIHYASNIRRNPRTLEEKLPAY